MLMLREQTFLYEVEFHTDSNGKPMLGCEMWIPNDTGPGEEPVAVLTQRLGLESLTKASIGIKGLGRYTVLSLD